MPDCPAQEKLTLRVGAKVILLKNLDQHAGLVNGCRGVVTGFSPPPTRRPIVDFFVGRNVSSSSSSTQNRRTLTRTVSRATWESKSGSTILPSVHVSFRDSAFTSGQAYVALSRTAHSERLVISKLRASDIKVSDAVVQFYLSLFGSVA